MTLNLYLLRHGETAYSANDSFCGDLDVPLTESGRAMAQAFAEEYHDLPWTAVYCSPLKRTLATAQPFCQAVKLEPQVREGLREISYGLWEGKTRPEVMREFHDDYVDWMTEPAWNAPSQGEAGVRVADRAMPVISDIRNTHATGNVLLVSHKGTIRIILCSLLGIDLGRYRDRLDMPTASVSLIRFDLHGPRAVTLGDRTHLPRELRARPGS
jgi:broad specificity phosphatase PhoE